MQAFFSKYPARTEQIGRLAGIGETRIFGPALQGATAGGQFGHRVAVTGSGVVVAWQGNAPDDSTGIYSQRFVPLLANAAVTDAALVLLLTDPALTTTRK